jgi:hypothetical protein
MATPRRCRHASWAPILALLASFTLAGCITGQRPTLGGACAAAAPTGRVEIDAVLDRLECVGTEQFTAEYEILTRLGNIESTATVVQASGARRSITINRIRYIFDGESTATCDLSAGTCEAEINEARTSDVMLGAEFYAKAFATRLGVDAGRRIGDPVASEFTIGGQLARCVDVPVTGGSKQYCALESGLLARYEANDFLIELTSYATTADESAFATS